MTTNTQAFIRTGVNAPGRRLDSVGTVPTGVSGSRVPTPTTTPSQPVNTGGGRVPTPVTTPPQPVNTGGGKVPTPSVTPKQPVNTGGGRVPTPTTTPRQPITTGGGKPPTPIDSPNMPATPGSLGLDFMRQITPNELVANQLQGLLDSDSAYMNNARLRGQEFAASRGMLNSSIAAGASQRSALEAAMPIAQSDADAYRTANQGNFESLSQLRQMRTAADLDNWLSSESYNRDFNGRLAMMPIQGSMDMMSYIQQRALEDPSVYTPEVISGINNFWNQNMFDVLGNYFNIGGGPNGG